MRVRSTNNIFNHRVWFFIFLALQSLFSQAAYAETTTPTISSQTQRDILTETPLDQSSNHAASTKPQQAYEAKQDAEKTAKELQKLRQSLADMEQENQRLKKDAEKRAQADIAQAGAMDELIAAKKELEDIKMQLASLKEENKALKNNSNLKWFIAGGCVFLLGWLIGFIVGRMKKKRPSLI